MDAVYLQQKILGGLSFHNDKGGLPGIQFSVLGEIGIEPLTKFLKL